jgi:multiple sugar transport system substrate-binding protein
MKKFLALLLAFLMLFALTACGEKTDTPKTEDGEEVTITLWTYPIGGWKDDETVQGLIKSFEEANPGIKVKVEYLDYTNGDDQVNTAIEGKAAPDLIMEGPERLVTNWGAKGYMVDLSDLWDADSKNEIYASIASACQLDGKYYEYPLCMIAHCMAVNYTRFEKAGIADLLDLETRTWTTENFIKAVETLAENNDTVAAIYCAGQGGDQGTRALINNLYGGTFTNPEHTEYTANSEPNIKALELLKGMKGVNFDASIAGGDEIQLFRQGVLDMAFCWNIQQQVNAENNDAGLTNDGDRIEFMAFPTDQAKPALCGGIWGFGIFDNGDAAKIEAAKTFIKYFANGAGTPDAVKASTFLPVRDKAAGQDLTQLFADDPITTEYIKILPLMGDYYNVVPGWAAARTAWWNMLQKIGTGTDVKEAADEFVATANAAAVG